LYTSKRITTPLHIFNHEEITTDSEAIIVGEREEDRREENSEEEGKVIAPSPRQVLVLRNKTPSS